MLKGNNTSVLILNGATATGTGNHHNPRSRNMTFLAKGSTTNGVGAVSVNIEATNFDSPSSTDWVLLGTITLTLGTTVVNDGFIASAAWKYIRANVTSISGTGASVSVSMGVE
jgi:hypothetical protein